MSVQPPNDRPENLPIHRSNTDLARRAPPRGPHRGAQSSDATGGLSPQFFFRVFAQSWKWVIPLGLLLSAIAGTAVMFFHVPKYEASAWLKIDSSSQFLAFNEEPAQRATEAFIQTQLETIRSAVILQKVISDPEIAKLPEILNEAEPLKHLEKMLNVRQVGTSDIYQIQYKSPVPSAAEQIANRVMLEYLKHHADERKTYKAEIIAALDKQLQFRKQEVDRLRNQVIELSKETTGRDPFSQGTILDIVRVHNPAAAVYQKLTQNEVEQAILQAEWEALNDTTDPGAEFATKSGMLELEIAGRPEVREMQEKIDAIDREMEKVKQFARNWESNPTYQRLKQQSDELGAQIRDLKVTIGQRIQESRKMQLEQERSELIAAKEREIKALQSEKRLLEAKYEQEAAKLEASGVSSAELEIARTELARQEKVLELIAARQLVHQTEKEAPARISIFDTAKLPSVALEPIPYKMLLPACLGMLVAPFGIAVLLELAVQKIGSSEQLLGETQLPILGEIARFPVRPVASGQHRLSGRQQREMYIFAESIDSLRTNLLLTQNVGREGHPKVLAVVSAGSGEGKTSVATSLAVSIAGASKRPTLIIDADLRMPDVADVLGVAPGPGLSDVLTNKSKLLDAIQRVGDTNAYVLPAGTSKVNPHHVVNGSKVEQVLNSLRSKFSTIVIDTPPVLGASEALVYAKSADLVIHCSLADSSRAKQVRAAVERLQSTGANVAGAVLSGVPIGRYYYAYGYQNGVTS